MSKEGIVEDPVIYSISELNRVESNRVLSPVDTVFRFGRSMLTSTLRLYYFRF